VCWSSVSVCVRKFGHGRLAPYSSLSRMYSVRSFLNYDSAFGAWNFFFDVISCVCRSRLKGCEAEVSALLDDQWRHTTLDWEMSMDGEDILMDARVGEDY
jgi:hypothetical protein